MSTPKKTFSPISDILKKYQASEEDKYVSREFQKYGFDLAASLGDMSHKALYIKLAKETPRGLLESAKSFVLDSNARSKGKLFMWKLKELKKELKEKEKKRID